MSAAGRPTWSCARLTCRYPGASRPALDDVSLDVAAGSLTAVLGPNGSGKSTLLRALLGTTPIALGLATFGGRNVAEWDRASLAREIGVVTQDEATPFPLSVRDLVGMGRYPHLGPWRREGAADVRAVELALARCDVSHLVERPLATLSGGERQRARIARALAQEPSALALDEPTVALDVRHEMEIFELLRELRTTGVTILLVTHHLNLAARYADRVVVLADGRVAGDGTPDAVLTEARVSQVYGWPVDVVPHADGAPQIVPRAGAGAS